MNTSTHAAPAKGLAVKRIGGGSWILRVIGSLDGDAVSALRRACSRALERDATDLVVDLGSVTTVSAEGAEALAAMADLMRGRNGALWIAAAWPAGAGYTLRPIREQAPAGLMGISPALDRALAGVPIASAEAGSLDVRDATTT